MSEGQTMGSENKTIDLTGLQCPLPVLRTQKILRDLPVGAQITVLATDPVSAVDMPHFCNTSGNELISSRREDYIFIFHIRKGPAPLKQANPGEQG